MVPILSGEKREQKKQTKATDKKKHNELSASTKETQRTLIEESSVMREELIQQHSKLIKGFGISNGIREGIPQLRCRSAEGPAACHGFCMMWGQKATSRRTQISHWLVMLEELCQILRSSTVEGLINQQSKAVSNTTLSRQ